MGSNLERGNNDQGTIAADENKKKNTARGGQFEQSKQGRLTGDVTTSEKTKVEALATAMRQHAKTNDATSAVAEVACGKSKKKS